jgi:tetratricopeptide (TPR) repeat protein
LNQIIADDPQDFQALAELGYAYLKQNNNAEAEKAYARATEVRPTFFLALLSLGRLRAQQKNFEGAIAVLDRAVTVQPASADANFQLGSAYLQIKKGSKAVGYLNEALKIDPAGKADAHLLLAALYNGAGMKDKAAIEYEEFLKQKPDYADRKKLEAYIAANKK